MKRLFVFFFALSLTACGGSSGSGESEGVEGFSDELAEEVDEGEQVEQPPVAEAPLEEPPASNPIVSTQIFGQNGNLWKPAGDDHGSSPGSLVVLLSGQFTEQFDSCEVRDTSGNVRQLTCLNTVPWTHRPYSCFSNPDASGWRQTWRSDIRCGQAAEVRVVCRSFNQEVEFVAPDGARGAVCQRFG